MSGMARRLGLHERGLTTGGVARYCPNLTNEERQQFKDDFNRLVDARVRALVMQGREVIVVGDLVSPPLPSRRIPLPRPSLTRRPSAEHLPRRDRLRQPRGAGARGRIAGVHGHDSAAVAERVLWAGRAGG